MKRFLLASITFLSGAVWAGDGMFGTRTSPAVGGNSSSAGSSIPFLQALVALGLVIVLVKWLLPKLASKVSNRVVTKLDGGLRIQESASFPGGTLMIVDVRGKTLLLSSSAQGIACLADLTPTASAEEPTPALSFDEVLAQVPVQDPDEELAQPNISQVAISQPAKSEVEEALARLARISG